MKKIIRRILLCVCIVVFVLGSIWIYQDYCRRQEAKKIYTELPKEVEPEEPKEPQAESEPEPEKIPIDFKKLKKQNSDVYAWIRIEGTRVDYPVLQHPTDDTYYLDYTIDGRKGYPGSIYTERINAKDFTDFNTVIYGHDMLDGTMFKDLHKYESEEFFEKNDTVDIYTETEHKIYRIFAAVVFSDQHLMYAYDYDNSAGRKEFIQAVYGSNNMKNHYRDGVTVDENSHILTLSTCIGNQPTKRWLVLAVEIDE